ncbi:tRNA glutamyl-Q(34) synthetase GluQRS [Elongatibacter sediminis]|uniref:Glutamyl-Q tRNA(Asp) synthetase n=1 Tax=Elongatibacter sediminis TaxID=3119006 RepID=A0AAW9RGI6_9GAMM
MGRHHHIHYVGRFAPSPTGDLHFGSLVAALASYLEARRHHGDWLIRIEDLDPPRVVSGSAERIVTDLARFGMTSDRPIVFQSERFAAYAEAIQSLLANGLAYWCGCSRRDLNADGSYPGTCANGLPPGRKPRAVRLRVPAERVRFVDRIQGPVSCDLSVAGDFVIRRADGLAAYQLAVALDDAFQGITDVVRGADLLDSTARQIHVLSCLGLPAPDYAHVPVVMGADGGKLSKSTASDPVRSGEEIHALRAALEFLGHPPPLVDFESTWAWALENWTIKQVPARPPGPTGLWGADG